MEAERIYILEGKRKARPHKLVDILPVWDFKSSTYAVQFLESCKYIFRNEDGSINQNQYDWNKGPGFSLHFWTNHKNSSMLGWRYNPFSDSFELSHYAHKNNTRVFTGSYPEYIEAKTRIAGEAYPVYYSPYLDKFSTALSFQTMTLCQQREWVRIDNEEGLHLVNTYGLTAVRAKQTFWVTNSKRPLGLGEGLPFLSRLMLSIWPTSPVGKEVTAALVIKQQDEITGEVESTSSYIDLPNKKLNRLIFWWFGGTFAAPHKVQIRLIKQLTKACLAAF